MKIIVTGSSSGIGRAITERLIAMDHQVIGLARNHNKFPLSHKNYEPHSIDLGQIANLENSFKQIHLQHPDMDVIICSAGYGHFVELEQFSWQQMQDLMNVNFLSQALLIKIFLPALKRRPHGKIIFLGSECALNGAKKASMYCATKFALRGFCQSLRKECAAANVAVSLINPGLVDTTFFDKLYFGPGEDENNAIQPEQIAEAVALIVHTNNNCVVEEINLQPMKKVIIKHEKIVQEEVI